MAELTQLESKLGEVMGLAQAAQVSTKQALKQVQDERVREILQRMHDEARETEQRCAEVAGDIKGKKTAIARKARETKSEARGMMETYLGDDADALDALEFLMMAEAGELGHLEIVRVMNDQAGDDRIAQLVDWVQPIQERHVRDTREAALLLAREEDPNEPAA